MYSSSTLLIDQLIDQTNLANAYVVSSLGIPM